MKTLVLGFLSFAAIMVVISSHVEMATLIQGHSLLLVFGGTAAVFLLATSAGVMTSVYASCRDLFKPEESFDAYSQELMELSQKHKLEKPSLNPIIHYAADLWASGIDSDLFIVLISQKRNEIDSKSLDAVQALKNLSKYPPALGMIGTVVGMISLFAHLDVNKANIGTSLSLAMTATFFGLVLTNGIVSPLADRLHVRQMNQQRTLDSIHEILLLINRGEPTALIKDELTERAA